MTPQEANAASRALALKLYRQRSASREEALELAELFGAAGRTVHELCDQEIWHDVAWPVEPSEARAAHAKGMRTFAATWPVRWTTAPKDYDGAGVVELESGEYEGQALRKVAIREADLHWQEGRYSSGLHLCCAEDPREALARARMETRRLQQEQAAREAKRAESLAWLAGLSDEQLQDEGQIREATWEDWRAEKKKRAKARQEQEHAETRARLEKVCPMGGTLYWPKVHKLHYGIRLKWAPEKTPPEVIRVEDDMGEEIMSWGDLAEGIERGWIKLDPDLPPRPVVKRAGAHNLGSIRKLEVDSVAVVGGQLADVLVWVVPDYPRVLVLGADGKKVRKQAVVHAALAAYHRGQP